MHQEHNIPWNLLAFNFTFIRDNPRITPRRTGLFPKDRPNQGRELNHFSRAMARTIATFSATERAKYPTKVDIPSDGKLFSDELRDRFPKYLDKKTQHIEYWISRARQRPHVKELSFAYGSMDGKLADVVKILMNENEILALLILAQHPKIPLICLWNLSWGHHFSVNRVAETALQGYIFCNLIAATNTLQTGEYKETREYLRFLNYTIVIFDFPAQNLPHIEFFGETWSNTPPDIHHDLGKLKNYLKTIFRLLYTYDMVMRECGANPRWESEIATNFFFVAPTRVEFVKAEDGRDEFTHRFA